MKIKESHLKKIIKEAAAEYVWGVKGPARVANQYSVSNLNIKGLVCEEVVKFLCEQADLAPTSHYPDVRPAGAGAGMIKADMTSIKRIEDKTKGWADVLEEIVNEAYALGVDPQLVGDFSMIWPQILPAIVDAAYAQYQMERPPPGM